MYIKHIILTRFFLHNLTQFNINFVRKVRETLGVITVDLLEPRSPDTQRVRCGETAAEMPWLARGSNGGCVRL